MHKPWLPETHWSLVTWSTSEFSELELGVLRLFDSFVAWLDGAARDGRLFPTTSKQEKPEDGRNPSWAFHNLS